MSNFQTNEGWGRVRAGSAGSALLLMAAGHRDPRRTDPQGQTVHKCTSWWQRVRATGLKMKPGAIAHEGRTPGPKKESAWRSLAAGPQECVQSRAWPRRLPLGPSVFDQSINQPKKVFSTYETL